MPNVEIFNLDQGGNMAKLITKEDFILMDKIANRAIELFPDRNIARNTILMDLEFVHERTPLRLKEFLDADNFNFAHDIVGINNHIDRRTKKLSNRFSPRFTA